MKFRPLLAAGVVAAGLMMPAVAEAAGGHATGTVNLRSGPGTGYSVLAVIPAGARINVWGCSSWCQVGYAGYRGWASRSYIAYGGAPGPYIYHPPVVHRPAAPTWGYYQRPWWDNRHNAWYDGRRWYFNGAWYNSAPRNGFSFGFGFSG